MTKRAKNAKKKNTPVLERAVRLVKAAPSRTLPAIAKAAKAIPVPAILLALGAGALGALAMFLFDATSGQRRRELIRDKTLGAGRDVSDIISKGGRNVRQRLESVATGATKRLRGAANLNGQSDQRMGELPMHT